jgi:N utilization substance protein B
VFAVDRTQKEIMQSIKKQNPSLQKKSAARLAAVQCLYTQAMTGDKKPAVAQVADLKKQLKNNRNEQKLQVGIPMEPDYALLTRILDGVAEWEDAINERIDGALTGGWSRARMGKLLVAVLTCGIFELLFDKDLAAKIITDEYTRLARQLIADDEADFVHGVLSNLAAQHG